MIIAFNNNINFLETVEWRIVIVEGIGHATQVCELKKSKCRTPANDIICTANLDKFYFLIWSFLNVNCTFVCQNEGKRCESKMDFKLMLMRSNVNSL